MRWHSQQHGLERYNCADSLDRTNAASYFGAVQVHPAMPHLKLAVQLPQKQDLFSYLHVPAFAAWPFLFARIRQTPATVSTVRRHTSLHMTFCLTQSLSTMKIQHTVQQQDANIIAFVQQSDQPACNISSYYKCQAVVTQRGTTDASEHAAATIACFV